MRKELFISVNRDVPWFLKYSHLQTLEKEAFLSQLSGLRGESSGNQTRACVAAALLCRGRAQGPVTRLYKTLRSGRNQDTVILPLIVIVYLIINTSKAHDAHMSCSVSLQLPPRALPLLSLTRSLQSFLLLYKLAKIFTAY